MAELDTEGAPEGFHWEYAECTRIPGWEEEVKTQPWRNPEGWSSPHSWKSDREYVVYWAEEMTRRSAEWGNHYEYKAVRRLVSDTVEDV